MFLKDENKNVLIFHDILEHVADPVSLVKKFSKQQKPGDKLFLAYPNSSSFKARILKTKWPMVAPLAHLNFFSINSTKILLENCGFVLFGEHCSERRRHPTTSGQWMTDRRGPWADRLDHDLQGLNLIARTKPN